jgi:membrane-associated protease RseP (regulator of RpoE activity)
MMHPSYVLGFLIALLIHEAGHLAAAKVCRVGASELGLGWGPRLLGFSSRGIAYRLRALPVGAYVRLDMNGLQRRPLGQQLFVLLAGVLVNLIAGVAFYGTFFGTINLLLAVTNLLPFYQQDGWKCGMVLLRALFGRRRPLVEWTFTLAGGGLGLLTLLGLPFARP